MVSLDQNNNFYLGHNYSCYFTSSGGSHVSFENIEIEKLNLIKFKELQASNQKNCSRMLELLSALLKKQETHQSITMPVQDTQLIFTGFAHIIHNHY